jgi:hypothetical protein
MRMLVRLRQWSGVLALFLVLAGGTAYAVNEWTGANIVNESLTGVDVKGSASVDGTLSGLDVKADTLKGADVLETSLGRVADADKLDNLDSSQFVQGASANPGGFGVSKAKVYFNRVTGVAGGTSTFLRVPGLLHLELVCSASAARVNVISDTADLDVFHRREDGSGGQTMLDPGQSVHVDASATDLVPRLEVTAGTGANTFGLQKLTALSIDVIQPDSADDCLAQVYALAQES